MKRERCVLLNTCMHLMVSEDFGRAMHSLRAAQLRQGNRLTACAMDSPLCSTMAMRRHKGLLNHADGKI